MKRIIVLLTAIFMISTLAFSAETNHYAHKQTTVKEVKAKSNFSVFSVKKHQSGKALTQNYLLLGIVLILLGTIYLVAPAVFGYLFITAGVMFVVLSLIEQGAI